MFEYPIFVIDRSLYGDPKIMNNKLKENRHILLFSLAWFLINLIQSCFTELHVD